MNKQRAAKLYELADRLSKLDVNTLSEQQRQQRSTMIAKLQEEVKTIKEFSPSEDGSENEELFNYAKLWYNGDMSTQENVEKALDLIGWEIGEVETEEGGAFMIKSGDENGNTYTSFTLEDLSDSETMSEEVNGEYDDEAGMAQSNLRTMARAVQGLLKTIEDNDNLPEWAQEKLAKAEMMLVSVWDYLQSQKEQGIDPKVQGVAEGTMDPAAEQDYAEWEQILRPSNTGSYALKLMLGQRLQTDGATTIRNILAYVKQNRQVLGKEVSDATGRTVKDAIIDIKNKFPQQYQAAQQPQGMAEGYDTIESDYQQWEDILVKDGYRGDPSGAYALELVVGHQLMSDPAEVASTIRNILTYVKQNRQVLGKAVSDRTTVKDAIIDIKNKFPQQYQAAQQPQGMAETKKPSPKLTPVNIKKSEAVSEEINKEAYERLQKVFAFKNYES